MPRLSSRKQKTLRLICWNETDASARATSLERAGYRVIADPPENSGGMVRYFRELAPDAVVIDLDRLPSHGRELGLSLRASKSTSHLRLIFAGGLPAKIELVRAAIPDAIFTPWNNGVPTAIERAIAQPDPPRLPSREPSRKTGPGSLERKLDIKPQVHFVIVSATRSDSAWLDELLTSVPEGAIRQRRTDATTTLALFPVATRRDLMRAFEQARLASAQGLVLDRASQADQPASRGLQPGRCPRGRTGPRLRRLQGVRRGQGLVSIEVRTPRHQGEATHHAPLMCG